MTASTIHNPLAARRSPAIEAVIVTALLAALSATGCGNEAPGQGSAATPPRTSGTGLTVSISASAGGAAAPGAGATPPDPPPGGGLYTGDGFSVELPAGRALEYSPETKGYLFKPTGARTALENPRVMPDGTWGANAEGRKNGYRSGRLSQKATIEEDVALPGKGFLLATSNATSYEIVTVVPGKGRTFGCTVRVLIVDKERLKADLDVCRSLKSLE